MTSDRALGHVCADEPHVPLTARAMHAATRRCRGAGRATSTVIGSQAHRRNASAGRRDAPRTSRLSRTGSGPGRGPTFTPSGPPLVPGPTSDTSRCRSASSRRWLPAARRVFGQRGRSRRRECAAARRGRRREALMPRIDRRAATQPRSWPPRRDRNGGAGAARFQSMRAIGCPSRRSRWARRGRCGQTTSPVAGAPVIRCHAAWAGRLNLAWASCIARSSALISHTVSSPLGTSAAAASPTTNVSTSRPWSSTPSARGPRSRPARNAAGARAPPVCGRPQWAGAPCRRPARRRSRRR